MKLPKKAETEEFVGKLLSIIDVLVDGRFIEDRRSLALQFRGSDNQRLIDVGASLAGGSLAESPLAGSSLAGGSLAGSPLAESPLAGSPLGKNTVVEYVP